MLAAFSTTGQFKEGLMSFGVGFPMEVSDSTAKESLLVDYSKKEIRLF